MQDVKALPVAVLSVLPLRSGVPGSEAAFPGGEFFYKGICFYGSTVV
jgi:hypothetical protein